MSRMTEASSVLATSCDSLVDRMRVVSGICIFEFLEVESRCAWSDCIRIARVACWIPAGHRVRVTVCDEATVARTTLGLVPLLDSLHVGVHALTSLVFGLAFLTGASPFSAFATHDGLLGGYSGLFHPGSDRSSAICSKEMVSISHPRASQYFLLNAKRLSIKDPVTASTWLTILSFVSSALLCLSIRMTFFMMASVVGSYLGFYPLGSC